MSRSYKKFYGKEGTFFTKDRCSKESKRIHTKKTRRYIEDVEYDIDNGSCYKKIVDSWDYHDWKFVNSLSEIKRTGKVWHLTNNRIRDFYRTISK